MPDMAPEKRLAIFIHGEKMVVILPVPTIPELGILLFQIYFTVKYLYFDLHFPQFFPIA